VGHGSTLSPLLFNTVMSKVEMTAESARDCNLRISIYMQTKSSCGIIKMDWIIKPIHDLKVYKGSSLKINWHEN
jgi:hypothetical protein